VRVRYVENRAWKDLLRNFKFILLPQVNPDGVIKNRMWIKDQKPTFKELALHTYRDLTSHDIEHGYSLKCETQMIRPENRALSKLFKSLQRINYYVSLHSTPLNGGVLFMVSADNPNY